MFGHLPELIIVVVIGLIVFGPEKLPEVAGNAGKMMREFRAAMDEIMHPIHSAVSSDSAAPDDFSAYYYESLARAGEVVPPAPGETEAMEIFPGVAGTEKMEVATPDDRAVPGSFPCDPVTHAKHSPEAPGPRLQRSAADEIAPGA